MMVKRIVTAAVLMPAVIALVLWAPTWAVTLAIAAVMLAALAEFFALGAEIGQRAYRLWTGACALALVYAQWLWAQMKLVPLAGGATLRGAPWSVIFSRPPELYDVFFLFVLGVCALSIFTRRPLVEAVPAAGISASGLLLVAFPLSFAIRIHGEGQFGPRLLLFALVVIWVSDSLAYFVGKAIGRTKLAPRLSPQKTWEGTAASLVGALLVGLAFTRWIPLPLGHLLAMAAAANIAGQLGDAAESAYKRSAGVKDSGNLLPGHGGILDRIDGLILAIPVIWYYWHLTLAAFD
jgi:phosphatidate cytidylyltransferase